MKAFPLKGTQGSIVDRTEDEYGMDLRDYFAIHATDYDIYKYQVEVIGKCFTGNVTKEIRSREEARYMFADAMMKAREQ